MCSQAAGASPLFPPQHPTEEAAVAEISEVVHRSPRLYGLTHSRWWLDGLRQVVKWLAQRSLPGVRKILRRLRIYYKRGRRYLHSPDPDYDDKLAHIEQALALARSEPQRFAFLYQDELTYYRRPSVGYSYALAGSDAPHANQGWRSNTYTRIAGSLDVRTGRFFTWQRRSFERETLIRYFRALAALYPECEIIFVALDNWPLHFHPDVLAALASTRIVLVPLPTYAPWTNPVEKVWRKLYQEVLHLHEFADDWSGLRAEVTRFLDDVAGGSTELLRYVGLVD
jgi:hypothetical protein